MDITFFHFGALFFGLVALYNLYSAHKYGESYLPVIVGTMMFISLVLIIIFPWQYGYIAFMLTAIFSVTKYRRVHDINKKKMKRYMDDSKNNESLKPIDYFTGWKLLHRLNKKYGPNKASLINSFFMWVFGILLICISRYMWPDIFSNLRYIAFIMTLVVLGFYWQNKKLLESLDSGDASK
ncbi:hypothetical protein [Methanolobus psychrotolerans]|uniref:hypothetical protein n=1 Tax=Methanolobus psychrotolerans TaxID=1874706 RepID=UPI000B91B524|nr:hypothetical protein [Methanolobus psychrotolerans]